MCGIAGFFSLKPLRTARQSILKDMISTLEHRGPDEQGFFLDKNIALGHSRLSIIDLAGGQQPLFNEDKSIAVVFNGEIYNYPELTEELKAKGHSFYTHSDTEVLVHAYEEYGESFLTHLNGQFAIALWDSRRKQLLLARDRVGIRPLFYTLPDNSEIVFASEMKAIFQYPGLNAEIDSAGLNQVLTLWVNVPPRTVFKNINELAPGHYLTISASGIKIKQYWKHQFPGQNEYEEKSLKYYQEKLREILFDAVTIRLRADVPVASYLSGGIDSSIISALVKNNHNNHLKTFSVAFADEGYDERKYQIEMVKSLKTDHKIIEANYNSIGEAFSDVVWYGEKPIIRTAPAPLYLLSGLVRDDNIKVVLTGEGADEVLGGYNIFKEDKVRRFWAEYPDSKWRPLLLSKLYPYIQNSGSSQNFWQLFFKKNLTDTENPYYSHLIRWNNTATIKNFFMQDFRDQFDDQTQVFDELNRYVDPDITKWHPFVRAQYLELQLFMSGYLLSSQGDRMMMGHSVEGRFPFLDHRVIEFAATIPPKFKMNVLNEKYLLKKTFEDILPHSIVNRAKQPYRAPIYQCFTNNNSVAASMFNEDKIDHYGYFDKSKVKQLINKTKRANGKPISARDDMAVVGISSLQLLHHHFIEKT